MGLITKLLMLLNGIQKGEPSNLEEIRGYTVSDRLRGTKGKSSPPTSG